MRGCGGGEETLLRLRGKVAEEGRRLNRLWRRRDDSASRREETRMAGRIDVVRRQSVGVRIILLGKQR